MSLVQFLIKKRLYFIHPVIIICIVLAITITLVAILVGIKKTMVHWHFIYFSMEYLL